MSKITLKIPNSSGVLLHAILELPTNQRPDQFAIFAHCFTCNSNFKAVRNISRSLTNHGFGVVRFDFTGLGRSEGEFANSHFEANVSDLFDVHTFMKQNYKAPILMIGHSLGGTAALAAGAQIDEVRAIATIGAPSETTHVKKHFAHGIKEVQEKGEAEVLIGARPFKINQNFINNFGNDELLDLIKKMRKKALLVMHAPFDKIVSVDHAQRIFKSAFHPKSFVSLDQADHLLSNEADSIYVGNIIGSWAPRYLPIREKKNLDIQKEQLVAHLDLVEDNFTTSIQLNKHFLIADEPESIGGDDFGPSPYELLISSLAACTVMTVKLYAQRKKWDVKEVYVYMSHKKIHVKDMSDGSGSTQRLDHISKRLEFKGDLTVEQKDRLIEISGRCPVHRTLQSEVLIDTILSS